MRRIVRTLQSAAKSALRPASRVMPIALACMLVATASQAGSANISFTTTINLTSGCKVGSVTGFDVTYLAFGPTVAPTAVTVPISCTNLLPYTVSLDLNSSGDDTAGGGQTGYQDPVVVLNYRLKLSGTGYVAAATPNGGAVSNTGSGVDKPLSIALTIPGGQPGSCATASCANTGAARTRTLLVSW